MMRQQENHRDTCLATWQRGQRWMRCQVRGWQWQARHTDACEKRHMADHAAVEQHVERSVGCARKSRAVKP